MFRKPQTSYHETDTKVMVVLRLANPISGTRFTLSFGLARDRRSDLDDLDAYSRRVDEYQRSIDLSANP